MAKNNNEANTFFIVQGFLLLFAGIAALIGLLFELVTDGVRALLVVPNVTPPKTPLARPLNQPDEVNSLANSIRTTADQAKFPAPDDFAEAFHDRLLGELQKRDLKPPVYAIRKRLLTIVRAIYDVENLPTLKDTPPLLDIVSGEIERARYADHLLKIKKKTDDPAHTMTVLTDALLDFCITYVKYLPPSALTEPEDPEPDPYFNISLVDAMDDLAKALWEVDLSFYGTEVQELGLFEGLTEATSSRPKNAKPLREFKGTSRATFDIYLKDRALAPLFDIPVPFDIPRKRRLEHWHMLAPTGWGKTQTLQHIIYHDLMSPDPPAMVVIDPKGDMLQTIQKLKIFKDDPDRLVIIDPALNPALNMFDMTTDRRANYSQEIREQVEATTLQQFTYIFSALETELSRKQSTAFSYVIRLMLSMGGNLKTFIKLMDDPAKELSKSSFRKDIEKLDETAQGFFESQFYSSFGITRKSLASKLYGLLAVPAFDRMFSAQKNKLDIFDCIQKRKVVLVNTNKALLQKDASSLFGRFIIAQTVSAAFERVAVPEAQRKPAYLIIDEAGSYFDDSLQETLTEVRSMGLGVLFAHQNLDQLNGTLRSSVMANTSIKFAGQLSDKDASAMAADMHTNASFLTSPHQTNKSTEFSAYVRGMTAHAVRLTVPYGTMESAPQMTNEQHQQLRERNRDRYGVPVPKPKPVEKKDDEPLHEY